MKNFNPKFARINLHKRIVRKLFNSGVCTTPEIVEAFKRTFLVKEMKTETSKSLNTHEDFTEANDKLSLVTEEYIKQVLGKKFGEDNNYLLITAGQKRKLIRLSKYVLKLTIKSLRDYAEKTFHRNVWLFDVTRSEADLLIKRLTEWEKKNEHNSATI